MSAALLGVYLREFHLLQQDFAAEFATSVRGEKARCQRHARLNEMSRHLMEMNEKIGPIEASLRTEKGGAA